MRINFDKIIIDNFLSFGHVEQSFRNRGYVSVIGENNHKEDSATSNGSGKSSLFNAICYALTGKTIQGISSNLNNIYTGGDMKVTLYFSVNDVDYVITRGKDSKGHPNLNIIINGEDKSGKTFRESEQLLAEYLPDITSELIGETIIIGQGMPYKFSDNSPSARKDNLENFSHSKTSYEEISLKVDNRLATLNVSKESLTNNAIKLGQKIFMLVQRQEVLYNKKQELDAKDVNSLSEEKKSTQKELKILDEHIKEHNEAINNLNDQLQAISGSSSETLEKNTNLLIEAERSHNEIIRGLDEQITSINNEIKTKEQLINSTVCPTCGQKLPHKENIDVEKNQKAINGLRETLNGLRQSKLNSSAEYETNIKELKEAINKEQAAINANRFSISTQINELRGTQSSENQRKLDLTIRLNSIENDIQNISRDKQSTCKELSDLEKQAQDAVIEKQIIVESLEELQAHIDTVTRMKTQVSRDFRGYLLSSTIKYIDDKCKEYALEIFGNDKLDFILDGNNIDITYQGKPLENLSGGEQQKVNLIIQFAIRDMVQEFTGFSTNILILDEILDNLDSMGCDRVLDFISFHLTNIESTFIISHHANTLNIGNDDTIRIIKDENGISRIE